MKKLIARLTNHHNKLKIDTNSFCTKNYSFSAVFLAFPFLLSLSGFAQKCSYKDTYPEKNTDSLERWLTLNPKINENRLTNLIKIERSYTWELSINRFKHLNEIEKVSQKLKNINGIVYYKIHKAELLSSESQSDKSVKLFTEALHIEEGLNDVSAQICTLSYLSLIDLFNIDYQHFN